MKAKVGEHYQVGGARCTVPDRCCVCGAELAYGTLHYVEACRAAVPECCHLDAYCVGCCPDREEGPK